MSDSEDTEQQALAYVYGELDGDEARDFEARLEADAQLRAEVDGLIATREMLDGDAQWSEEQGLDDPPPHLVGAILRAEALARPKEIRVAAAAAAKGEQSWVQRMSLWIIGGGAALTAAATLLVFVGQQTMLADEAAPMAAAPAQAAKAERAYEGADALSAADPAVAGDGVFAEDNAPDAERPMADQLAVPGAPPVARRDARAANVGTRDAKDSKPMEPADTGFDRAEPMKSPKAKEKSRSGFGDDDADGRMALGQAVRGSAGPAGAITSPSTGAISGGGGMSSGESGLGYAGGKKGAAKADDVAGGSFDSMDADESSAPEALEEEVAPPAPVAKSSPISAPPKLSSSLRRALDKSGARAKRRAPTTQAEKKKAEVRTQGRTVERTEAINLHYATGERELAADRPLSALDEFHHAHRLDPAGKIVGPGAVSGIMRANHALGRHKEVLAYVPLLKKHGLKTRGVSEGLLLAGDSAERLGRLDEAERLYTDASTVVATRKRAKRAMSRMRARSEADMEAPAAEAAAAEP